MRSIVLLNKDIGLTSYLVVQEAEFKKCVDSFFLYSNWKRCVSTKNINYINGIDSIKKSIDELKSDISTIKEKQHNLQKLHTITKTNLETTDKVFVDSLENKKITNSSGLASESGSTSNWLSESVKAVDNTESSCDGDPIRISGSDLSGCKNSVNRFQSSGDGGSLKREKPFIDSGFASDGGLTSNLRSEIANLTETIEKLEEKINNLETLVYNIDFDLDCLEQYSRRNCLLLHGSNERDLSG